MKYEKRVTCIEAGHPLFFVIFHKIGMEILVTILTDFD